jgi:hypothetical protein
MTLPINRIPRDAMRFVVTATAELPTRTLTWIDPATGEPYQFGSVPHTFQLRIAAGDTLVVKSTGIVATNGDPNVAISFANGELDTLAAAHYPAQLWARQVSNGLDLEPIEMRFVVRRPVTDADTLALGVPQEVLDRLALEAVGAGVPQEFLWNVEQAFIDYAVDAATAGGIANRRFLGGDVLDWFTLGVPPSSSMIVGADWWAAGTPAIDTTTQDFLAGPVPFRNGMIQVTDSVPQFDAQIFAADNDFLSAQVNGGEAAPLIWWITGGYRKPPYAGADRIMWCCHLHDPSQVSSPSLGVVDSSIIRSSLFGTYENHVNTGWGPAANFWLHKIAYDVTDDLVYGMGMTLHDPPLPLLDPADIDAHRAARDAGHKIARCAPADVMTVAAWEFWTGAGWSSDPTQAAVIVDNLGNTVHGFTGRPVQVQPGVWINVGRLHVLDPFVEVWRATAGPQGPYTNIARVPLPGVGAVVNDGPMMQVSHHVNLVPHLTAPPECSLAMATCTHIGDPADIVWTNVNIRRFLPRFVVVPWSQLAPDGTPYAA